MTITNESDVKLRECQHEAGVWLGETTFTCRKCGESYCRESALDKDHLLEMAAEALSLYWNEATGQYDKKSCGHNFTCICVGEKVSAAIHALQQHLGKE